jgi:pimeloyl-ACP methyl ester carboxylesterase
VQLHLRTWGNGDRLAVLIHGLSSQAKAWDGVATALAARGYRVVAPDLRGHGQSPRGYYSVTEWIDDVLESVPLSPDLAIGHSLGAVVLLEAVTRLRPARAVYVDPPWPIGPDPELSIAEFESRKQLTQEAIARANPRWTQDEVGARFEGFTRWDQTTARSFISGRSDHTPTGPPPQPSLVVLADGTPFIPEPTAERLGAAGWDVRTIPGTRHYVHLDDHAAFMDCVLGWLNGPPGSRAAGGETVAQRRVQ